MGLDSGNVVTSGSMAKVWLSQKAGFGLIAVSAARMQCYSLSPSAGSEIWVLPRQLSGSLPAEKSHGWRLHSSLPFLVSWLMMSPSLIHTSWHSFTTTSFQCIPLNLVLLSSFVLHLFPCTFTNPFLSLLLLRLLKDNLQDSQFSARYQHLLAALLCCAGRGLREEFERQCWLVSILSKVALKVREATPSSRQVSVAGAACHLRPVSLVCDVLTCACPCVCVSRWS